MHFVFLCFLLGWRLPDTGSNLKQADQHTLSTFAFVTGLIHYESLKAQVFSFLDIQFYEILQTHSVGFRIIHITTIPKENCATCIF